jgi:hypothetical protein
MGPSPRWDGDSNFNDSLGMAGSYYAATANPAPIAPRLKAAAARASRRRFQRRSMACR